MPIRHWLLVAFVMVTVATAEEIGSPKNEEDASESQSDNANNPIAQEAYQQIEQAADRLIVNGNSLWKIQEIVQAKQSDKELESVSNDNAIVQEAYQQSEDAADRLIANGDTLSKIQTIVQAKRSKAKTADLNRKMKSILGPSTTVEIRFVSYSYDETVFGDEKHVLEWDMLRAADETAKQNESTEAAQDDPPSSYRFSLHNPMEEMSLKLPGDWGEFNFLFNLIACTKGNDNIDNWTTWTIPSYKKIENEEINKRMSDDDLKLRPISKRIALMKKIKEEVEPIVREKFEKLKAETPEFSFATAVPGLFQEMSETLGVSKKDVEEALEAIKSVATREIYFDDMFRSSSPQDEQCQSCS